MTAVLTDGTTMATTGAASTGSRRRRYTAVPADLLERFKVSEWTLLRWRRRGWLGGTDLSWADAEAGWAQPEVVAQIAWLVVMHELKRPRRVDAADVAAGPALRAAGCLYGWRALGSDCWEPADLDALLAIVATTPGAMIARVHPLAIGV
jgi:hypothetical protein